MEEVMQVELIAYSQWNGSDKEMEAIVEQAASVCYDSSPTEEKKLSKQCAKSGHTSVFEHISYTFHIKGVSRALLAQLSRHRHISLSVRSQRYCREDDFDYVNPYPTSDPKMYDIYASVNRANEDYQNLIAEGAAPEDARMVLPNACCTELHLTMNARTMIEIGYLRLCSRAQKEIRTLFMKIKECIKDCSPKARQESRDFYEVLDYYLEMIRGIHKRTYEYLGEMKASTNPIQYCEGGFYGGHLKPSDKIKPLLKPMTASFGITALNELQELYNGKSIAEDGEFALEVMRYINDRVNEFKEADGWLYAIYGTPAESLCGLQVEQFRAKYGIIENVSDRPYVSNSFHCHVTEELTPIQKQDLEGRFWNLCNGGKIQYVRYPIDYNIDAIKALVRRAMALGFYEGVNLSLAYCDDCGHQELEMDECPKCGSKNLTKIDRMNGYLSYSRVHGDTRLNAAKMAEIKERKSM